MLALYAIGTWIILQGGKSFAEIPGLEGKAPVTSAYQAVLIVGTLLGILSAVGIRYMRTSVESGEGLLPVVAIADVGPHDMRSWTMCLYQAFFFLVFLLVPAIALYQLNDAVLERGVLWHDGDAASGGVALKNDFALTRGTTNQDMREYACRNQVTRSDGFVWLANTRCDLVKANGLQPFDKTGKSIAEDAASAAPSCTRDLAMARKETCDNARDISEECESSERHCRGIQWLPVLSPLLLAGTTIFGWAMFAWLIAEACYRKAAARKLYREAQDFQPEEPFRTRPSTEK
ncbi:MAG: hypothetical protein WA728_02965 [Xanthobacteraceae bacterium]